MTHSNSFKFSIAALCLLLFAGPVLGQQPAENAEAPEAGKQAELRADKDAEAQVQPAEKQPGTKPADESQAADPEPSVQNSDAEPAKTEPAEAEPAKTEPAKTEPAKTEPAKTEPAKTEPAKAESESDDGEAAAAEEDPEAIPAGHSIHGEAFNEGPRQAASMMKGTGPIKFAVTSEHAGVQAFIEQGIGQLHGFWYFEAERSFRQAAMLDPDCAISYWGMAMANAENKERAKGFLAKALERRDSASEREQLYIDALENYLDDKKDEKGKERDRKTKAKQQIEAFEKIVKKYPDDLEAKAWLAYTLYKQRGAAGKKHEEVETAINNVLDVEPLHPVHHYLIHLWDYKDAKKALGSAAKGGASAPAIAHMWHMPGHIYSRLKRYQDAAWQQEASARTDHAHMMRDRVMPDEIHNFAHNNEWLIRNLIYVGRWRDAIDLAKNMTELPRHPKYNMLSKRRSSYFGRIRLFDVLKRYEHWPQLIALTDSAYLPSTDLEAEQIRRLQYRGIAFAHLHHVDQVDVILTELNGRLDKEREKAAEAKCKHEEAVAKAKEDGKKPPAKPRVSGEDPVRRLEKAIASIEGRLSYEYGDYKEALSALKKADEDKSFRAYCQLLSGDKAGAMKAIEEEVGKRENQVLPLATQIEMLWIAGNKDRAREVFDKLRGLSGSVQFGAAPFDRLAPIAKELGYDADWRVAHQHPDDFGERPELDAIGPFRWAPSPAENWSLKDHKGKELSLSQFRGKPVILIFYLGHGCLHCAEQLQAFAPKAKQFTDAGISLVAISTDSEEDLKISVDTYEGGMPFPLVSNQSLEVFEAYRAFDDFEQIPLHGTFLIDSEGQVVWRDLGYEPFMDVDFTIKEAKRLLKQEQPLPQELRIAQLPERQFLKPISIADLPRIDSTGVKGSLIVSGAEVAAETTEHFFQLAKGEAAKVVVLQVDNEDGTKSQVQSLLDRFNQIQGSQLSVVRCDGKPKNWSALLADASAVWIAGSQSSGFESLAKVDAARVALAEFLHSGKVIASVGAGGAMFADQAFSGEKSNRLAGHTFGLLKDSILDVYAANQEGPSRIETVIQWQPHRIGYELDPTAAMVIRGRRVYKLGEGTIRIRRHAGKDVPNAEVRLQNKNDAADLVSLYRAARDGMAGYPVEAKPSSPKVDKGTLILIGGGGMPKGIMQRFVDLAGGKKAKIVVLPTAMPDPIPKSSGIADQFKQLGAEKVTVLSDRSLDKVEGDAFLKSLKEATGIWYGGGRQWRFVDAYLDTKAHQAMRDVLKRGGVIMGSSAGASIQAEFLARGNPLGNLDIMAEGYQRGLGFLPGVAVDQHFSQRQRQDDMLALVKRYPKWLGIGLDEATAIVVQKEVAEVVGRSKVFFHNATDEAGDNIDVVELADGQRYNLTERKAVEQ